MEEERRVITIAHPDPLAQVSKKKLAECIYGL